MFVTVKAAPHSKEPAFITLCTDMGRAFDTVERLAQVLHYRLSNKDLAALIAELNRRTGLCPDA